MTAVVLSLLFNIGYAINVWLDLKTVLFGKSKNLNSFRDLPLTFDCPIFIAFAMFGFTLCLLMPYTLGKSYFNCTSDQSVLVDDIPQENWSCGILGYFAFIFIQATFWYMGLLSFAVFRYVYNPEAPLFRIKKVYYHLSIWLIILCLFIGSNVAEMYGNLPPVGLCGPSFSQRADTYTYVLIPLITITCVFVIFTPCSIYYTVKHLKHETSVGGVKQRQSELIHLSIRLIIYQFFVAAACISFIWIVISSLNNYDRTLKSYANYLFCLLDTGEEADVYGDVCSLGYTLDNSVYYIEGVVALLVSSASFALSCSTRRMEIWKNNKMVEFIGSKTKKTLSKAGTIRSGSSKGTSSKSGKGSSSVSGKKNSNKNRDHQNENGNGNETTNDDSKFSNRVDPSIQTGNVPISTNDGNATPFLTPKLLPLTPQVSGSVDSLRPGTPTSPDADAGSENRSASADCDDTPRERPRIVQIASVESQL